MKMIGLIGGMSWESSAEYYRILNEGVRDRLGPTASARCLLWSFNFAEIEDLQHRGDWPGLTARMVDAARRLEAGGADVLLICTNTMHRMAADVQAAVDVPLLHIADPTAERIKAAGLRKVGLLGTAFTMEHAFYKGRLTDQHGLNVIVPDDADRATVHRIIYEELVAGKVLPASRDAYRAIIARLVENGAEAVILELNSTELNRQDFVWDDFMIQDVGWMEAGMDGQALFERSARSGGGGDGVGA